MVVMAPTELGVPLCLSLPFSLALSLTPTRQHTKSQTRHRWLLFDSRVGCTYKHDLLMMEYFPDTENPSKTDIFFANANDFADND